MHNFFHGNKYPKIRATYFSNLKNAKRIQPPKGENSPSLVTLLGRNFSRAQRVCLFFLWAQKKLLKCPQSPVQGCQRVYFQTQNPSLGRLWTVLQYKIFILLAFCLIYGQKYILWPFGIFSPFWYVLPRKIWQHCPGSQNKNVFSCVAGPLT
jgi:hypothetical protein